MVKNAAFERQPPSLDHLALDRVGYDPATDSHHGRYHELYGTLTEYVVEFVAAVTDSVPEEMPPLFDAVDPEALERLVGGNGRHDVSAQFVWAGCTVTVSSNGDVVVADRDAR